MLPVRPGACKIDTKTEKKFLRYHAVGSESDREATLSIFFKSWATSDGLKAYRTAKYKQRRQLNHTFETKTKFFIENPTLQVGACTALSADWIKQGLMGKAESRVSSLTGSSYFEGAADFAKSFNSTGSSYEDRLKWAVRKIGKTPTAVVKEDDFTAFATLLGHLRGNPGFHLILMEFSGVATTHVCAAHTSSSTLIFFDPNSGEYSADLAAGAAFFTELVEQYKTYVSQKRSWGRAVPTVIYQQRWTCCAMADS